MKRPPSSPSTSKNKIRIDVMLVERSLVESRQRAQAMIMAGQVRVDGRLARKPSEAVSPNAQIEIAAAPNYASRAGAKLEGALADFQLDVAGCVCADIGASNGGFTDCLLRHGAARVYAIDVNTKQLDWKLQQNARVQAIQKNARFVASEDLGELVDVVTVDVSFISVTKIIAHAVQIAKPGAALLILVKPQFELEKKLVPRGGIVRDPELHAQAITHVRAAVEKAGLHVENVHPSRVTGAEGNQEFFLLARRPGSS